MVEMITVTAIFVIVTGVLLTNLPDFKSKTNIDLAAQQIALNIRGAQVFSLGTKGSGSTGSQDSTAVLPSYGIYFSTDSPNSYILFRDIEGVSNRLTPNNRYDGDKEKEETYQIDPYFKINHLCVTKFNQGTSQIYCVEAPFVDIFFKRPKVQALIFGGNNPSTNVGYTKIQLCSNRNVDLCRVIKVYTSGQIEILKGNFLSTS